MGGHRLLGRLGAGGMGRVYLGRSRGGRLVAVKLVHAELVLDPMFRRRFRREVEAARRVGGEWTAPVLDADTESDTPWVATGYVPGPTLDQTVERHGPLPTASVLALASGLAHALRAVHACGLVHRDLKPSNVLVTVDGPRVIDFGIARSVDASVVTRTGALVGTPAFMSPEQVRGEEPGPAGDVFSLGSVLAYAATGRRPFGEGLSGLPALLLQVAQGRPQLGGLSGPVRELVEACLAKEPGERPTLAAILDSLPPVPASWLPAEIVTELGRHAAGLLALEDVETAAKRPTRLYLAAGATAAAVTVAAAAMGVALTGDGTGAEGDVPPAMLGTWEGWVSKAGTQTWWLRRVTLSQGRLGADVARIRVVDDTGFCEYTAALSSSAPSVKLRARVTRGVPPGRCGNESQQTMTMNGDKVHWAAHDVSGTLTRARNDAVPAVVRGRWTGTSEGLTAVASAGVRRRFDIGDGAVGTETVRISVANGSGLICDSMATLVSAERDILVFPSRMLTQKAGCVLGGLQKFTPQGASGLRWEYTETGEAAALQRS
nr:hypothetical protein GCM10010200_025400 [Actinomadura rugatobispora]